MFVRQVTSHFKPGKFELLGKKMEQEVIPLLKKQPGFRDELSFFDKNKGQAIAMSFWDNKSDAEKYAKDVYPTVHKEMAEMIDSTPEIKWFEVGNSTWYNIHAA